MIELFFSVRASSSADMAATPRLSIQLIAPGKLAGSWRPGCKGYNVAFMALFGHVKPGLRWNNLKSCGARQAESANSTNFPVHSA